MTWSDPDDGVFRRGGAQELGLGSVWALEQGIDYVRRMNQPAEQLERRIQGLVDELDRLPEAGVWQLPVSAGTVLARHGCPKWTAFHKHKVRIPQSRHVAESQSSTTGFKYPCSASAAGTTW